MNGEVICDLCKGKKELIFYYRYEDGSLSIQPIISVCPQCNGEGTITWVNQIFMDDKRFDHLLRDNKFFIQRGKYE